MSKSKKAINNSEPTEKKLLTPEEAAERYGRNVQYIRRNCKSGDLKAQNFGRFYLIDPVEIEKWIESRKPSGRPRKGEPQ